MSDRAKASEDMKWIRLRGTLGRLSTHAAVTLKTAPLSMNGPHRGDGGSLRKGGIEKKLRASAWRWGAGVWQNSSTYLFRVMPRTTVAIRSPRSRMKWKRTEELEARNTRWAGSQHRRTANWIKAGGAKTEKLIGPCTCPSLNTLPTNLVESCQPFLYLLPHPQLTCHAIGKRHKSQ